MQGDLVTDLKYLHEISDWLTLRLLAVDKNSKDNVYKIAESRGRLLYLGKSGWCNEGAILRQVHCLR